MLILDFCVYNAVDYNISRAWGISVRGKARIPTNTRWPVSALLQNFGWQLNLFDSYALIFSMLYQYHRIIPATYHFRIFGTTLNDKMFLYVPALQVTDK